MNQNIAFVFGGGGSHGALQVGALHAMLEKGLQPGMLVGTSIGAVNAAFLAIHGFNRDSLDRLALAWRSVIDRDLFPTNFFWLTIRAMFGRVGDDPSTRIREFLIEYGLSPQMRFADLQHPRLVVVSSDLESGDAVLHGLTPEENVLEAVLVSSAIPPWTQPVKKHGRTLMDGAVVSHLPIEAAIRCGASEIIGLDLLDDRDMIPGDLEAVEMVEQMINAVAKRQIDLEVALAEARGIPIQILSLIGKDPISILDFSHTDKLITQGYEQALKFLNDLKNPPPGA